jgi:hypothetical protein
LVVALAILATAAALNAEVIARGALLDYLGDYEVVRARVFGVEFYVDISGGRWDTLTAMALSAGAGGAWLAAWLLRGRQSAAKRVPIALAVSGAITTWAALDEALAIHETIGHNLGFLVGFPVIHAPDDLIVGLYGIFGAAAAWRIGRILRPSRGPAAFVLAAAVLLGAAVLLDVAFEASVGLEEYLEVLAGGLLALGLLAVSAEAVLRAFVHDLGSE